MDPPEDVPDCSFFKTLKFFNVTETFWQSFFSDNLHRQVKYMITRGARVIDGLGKYNRGSLFKLTLPHKGYREGVGYKRGRKEYGCIGQENKHKKLCNDDGWFEKDEKWCRHLILPGLNQGSISFLT
ncbi:hypothetical protein PTKIN_Ptkin12aG0103700 [Pterospermum kingtungense]